MEGFLLCSSSLVMLMGLVGLLERRTHLVERTLHRRRANMAHTKIDAPVAEYGVRQG